jgi:predicted nucleic acid-binding protein
MKNYMVDTNIINRILDHGLDLQNFKKEDTKIFATHVQRDEINKTADVGRRDSLLSIFQEIVDSISTETAFWGISKWNEAKWSSDDLAQRILKELNKKKRKKNNTQDALIADTAIKNNCILVTEDGYLYDVVTEDFDGSAQKIG